VDFHVPEIYLPKLKSDQPLTIAVDAYPGQQFSGRIYAIDPAVDQQTRTVLVRAHAPNPRGELRPGMFTKVNLALGSRENALLVPEQAIVPKGQDNFVFRILDGRAALTKVELGLRSPGFVEIVAGLDAADTVVTDGQIKLQDGMPVMDIAHLPPQKASAEGK
jgi:membrane fusion protein (multidrug efflux system)